MNQPTYEQRASAHKGRLVQALADLAGLDEQREKLKNEIDALRNFLSGITLGQQIAAESQRAAQQATDDAKHRGE